MFGELHFHPPNGFKFFEILEHVLEHKFQQFPTKEIIDLLLSFIYIERYPLNTPKDPLKCKDPLKTR